MLKTQREGTVCHGSKLTSTGPIQITCRLHTILQGHTISFFPSASNKYQLSAECSSKHMLLSLEFSQHKEEHRRWRKTKIIFKKKMTKKIISKTKGDVIVSDCWERIQRWRAEASSLQWQ